MNAFGNYFFTRTALTTNQNRGRRTSGLGGQCQDVDDFAAFADIILECLRRLLGTQEFLLEILSPSRNLGKTGHEVLQLRDILDD